jgi:hypothetical protein
VAVVWERHGSSSRAARAAAAAADMGAEVLRWGGRGNGPTGMTSAVLGVFRKLSRASASRGGAARAGAQRGTETCFWVKPRFASCALGLRADLLASAAAAGGETFWC